MFFNKNRKIFYILFYVIIIVGYIFSIKAMLDVRKDPRVFFGYIYEQISVVSKSMIIGIFSIFAGEFLYAFFVFKNTERTQKNVLSLFIVQLIIGLTLSLHHIKDIYYYLTFSDKARWGQLCTDVIIGVALIIASIIFFIVFAIEKNK